MCRKMVVGYAADRHGHDALALARLLASAEPVEEVLLVEAVHGRRTGDERGLVDLTTGWPAHVSVSSRVVRGASPADTLTSTADDEAADLLVLGSSHRGFAGRLLAGTTAGTIFPDAKWPVAIAPQDYSETSSSLGKIGVAYDGSEESEAALRWAVALASAFSATMRLVAVVQPPPPPAETWAGGVPADTWDSGFSTQQSIEAFEAMRKGMRGELEAARASVGQDDAETVVITGDARYELREAAEDLDMLVVGSHRGGRIGGALLRSVSRGLAHSCPVPLAVVPARVRAETTTAAPEPSPSA